MKLFYKICICGLVLTSLLGCGEKKAPTKQIEYATVTGIVHYRYFSEVTLIEGAEVKIMNKVDTTDAKGKYTIEGIQYGEYEISCTHPDYDTFVVEVEIARDNYLYDICMWKGEFDTLASMLPVEEDATVKFEYEYYDSCSNVTLVDSNYGSAANVVIGGCYSFVSGSHGVGDECLIKRWRALIKLPNVNTLHQYMIIDSAKLYLTILGKWFVINNKMIIKRVLDDWDENTVTWNSMPDTSDNQGIIELANNDTVMVVDVTDNYKNEYGDHYGLIISNDYEESNCCCVGTNFWFNGWYDIGSSENPDPHKRPYVVIYTRQ